jgi:hypothetical protein
VKRTIGEQEEATERRREHSGDEREPLGGEENHWRTKRTTGGRREPLEDEENHWRTKRTTGGRRDHWEKRGNHWREPEPLGEASERVLIPKLLDDCQRARCSTIPNARCPTIAKVPVKRFTGRSEETIGGNH